MLLKGLGRLFRKLIGQRFTLLGVGFVALKKIGEATRFDGFN
jgi:hypothetical protein